MDIKDTKTKRKAGRPPQKAPIIKFAEVRKYIKGLEMKYAIYRNDIIRQAEKNGAPEHIIDILLKLKGDGYHYYYEIQRAFNEIQQTEIPKKEETPIDIIKKELDEQKEVCKSKDRRIERLEEHNSFWNKVCWGIPYSGCVILIVLGYIHMAITIASNSKYSLITALTRNDLIQNGQYWVLDGTSVICLDIFTAIISVITILSFLLLWCIIWDED